MAKYESEGYCPCNEFSNPSILGFKASKHAGEVTYMLKDFIALAVYTKNGINPKGDYFAEIMLGTKLLGLKIAQTIITLNSITKFEKILITDYLNPLQIDGAKYISESAYISDKGVHFCDEGFFVALNPTFKEGLLQVSIYKF